MLKHLFLNEEAKMEELKKQSFRKALVTAIVLLIIGAGIVAICARFIIYEKFEDLAPEEIKNQNVTIDLTANFGSYLEEYSENTKTHKRTTTDLYYVIWTGDDEATEYKYMSVKVPVKYEKQMEEIAENSANETFSEPFHMVGHIHKLGSEEYRYFKEYFLESDFSESEIDEYTLPYYIDISGTSAVNGSDLLFVIFICVGGFFILWGIVRLIKAVTGSYMKHFNNGIQEAGYSESAIESDMNHATGFHKNDIRLGNLCFYFGLNSTVPHAIPVSKLHWAYQTTTTHRTNGIKTGTTYAIVVRADVKGGNFTIAIPDNGTAQAILDQINVKYPWVVVGFSNELVKMYNKNRAEFLDMRYNKVDHYPKQPGMEGFNDGFNDSFNDNYNQFT